jgi:hypothetical protein
MDRWGTDQRIVRNANWPRASVRLSTNYEDGVDARERLARGSVGARPTGSCRSVVQSPRRVTVPPAPGANGHPDLPAAAGGRYHPKLGARPITD